MNRITRIALGLAALVSCAGTAFGAVGEELFQIRNNFV